MKKILFCAAAAMLAAACTSEDDLVLNQGKDTKGLTFDVSIAENATTRGELWKDENGTYPFFWYAEQDLINVQAINVIPVTSGYGANTASKGVSTESTGVWSLASVAASYKATKSEGNGQFTAATYADMLALKDYDAENAATTTATIVATYGGVKASTVKSKLDGDGDVVAGSLKELALTTIAGNASQTVARANVVEAPMYSVSSAVKENVYDAFGEKASLKMVRPFPVIRFTTANTNEYLGYFGKLQSVELYAMGGEDANGTAIARSNLAYDNNKVYTVEGTTKGFAPGYAPSATPYKVVVNLTDGTWSDDDAVYMTVAPVSRKAFRDKSAKEALKVVYKFQHITFTLDGSNEDAPEFEAKLQTSNDWTAVDKNGNPNAITPLPSLDINNYNYLVVGAGADRTLIVIKGTFSDIFNEDADAVVWDGTDVPLNKFTTIISNVALTDDEMQKLDSFTILKNLTLKENTSIPAKTFSTANAATLETLVLPKVTSIAQKFIGNNDANAFSKLTTIIMPAYEFEDEVVNKAFFNSDVKGELKTIDMSGVRSMMPKFGILRTLSFKDYALLEEITVQDNMIVSPSGFAGCTSLKTINGIIDIADAPNAFDMNTSTNAALKKVALNGRVIPNAAFKNCTALEEITYNGAAIAPTSVGETAFFGASSLKYLDLSETTTLGSAAFNGAGLVSNNKDTQVLTVGAEELPYAVFANTKIVMIKLTDATKITGDLVFRNTSNLRQIKFLKVVSLANATSAYTVTSGTGLFGATSNIDLWVNPDQTGVSGLNWTLSAKIGSATSATNFSWTFKSIQKKIED